MESRRAAMRATRSHTEAAAQEKTSASMNRSLERGLCILRCFRPGLGALGNAEVAERTGLPKATVSRLMQTLAHGGFLKKDPVLQTYRLSFSVLSLAHAVMLDSQVVHEAVPLMQALSARQHINVGLSVPDELDMVYLHVAHGDRSRLSRRIEPGHRRPMETNAVGRAYLASLSRRQRAGQLLRLKARHERNWPAVAAEIEASLRRFEAEGHCSVVWGHGTESTAMPLIMDEGTFVLNVSYSIEEFSNRHIRSVLLPALHELAEALRARLAGCVRTAAAASSMRPTRRP
ncbi:helix-turn-helix domain-containing protein [Pigmentiphaga sp. YJ18]|uniref:IclR family transcriptional regulator n=1 Tax=unclassified Pigmentiphaga TaxID=2626614 RepID=UPI0013754BA0|nr:helix-turn-helix domain-containing protein [Pigmentiphaga sp. H8]